MLRHTNESHSLHSSRLQRQENGVIWQISPTSSITSLVYSLCNAVQYKNIGLAHSYKTLHYDTASLKLSLVATFVFNSSYRQCNYVISLVPVMPLNQQQQLTILRHLGLHTYTPFLPRDATQSVVLPSYIVCLSVRLSVCLYVTFRYGDHIGWNSSKITSRLNSLTPSLWGHPTWAIWCNGNTPKIGVELGWGHSVGQKTCNISETVRDTTKVTITD